MLKKLIALLLIVSILALTGCYTNTHVVGNGAKGKEVITKQQWFALWGLVPISEVDSKDMADGAKDYEVTTQFTPTDIIIGFFTSWVTIMPMTVQVEK